MNKTNRKNKTNIQLNWPGHGTLFTIKELWSKNPDLKEITLRVHLDNAIKKENKVSCIGYKNMGKGRPIMILTMNPVYQELLDKAYASGIQPPENKVVTVTVLNVKPSDEEVADPVKSTVELPCSNIVSA